MGRSSTTSDTAKRPPVRKTRCASLRTWSLSAARLMTQLEMMTSTEWFGRGIASIEPRRNSTFSKFPPQPGFAERGRAFLASYRDRKPCRLGQLGELTRTRRCRHLNQGQAPPGPAQAMPRELDFRIRAKPTRRRPGDLQLPRRRARRRILAPRRRRHSTQIAHSERGGGVTLADRLSN